MAPSTFPIHDAAGNTVGAMFVVRDVSSFYLAMKHTQCVLIIVTVAALLLGTLLVMLLLNSLVCRLDCIIAAATRVVGGDYHTSLQVTSDDEVGKIEELFEQFRRVFVDVLANVPGLTQSDKSPTRAGSQVM